MENQDVKVGQVWERKDGRRVKLTAERMFRGSRELELTPLTGGRKSWKWDGGIINDLKFVQED